MNLKYSLLIISLSVLAVPGDAFELPRYRVKLLAQFTQQNFLAGVNSSGDAVISNGYGVFYYGADGNTFQIPLVSRGIGLNDAGQVSVMRGPELGIWSRETGFIGMGAPPQSVDTDAWSLSEGGKVGYVQYGPRGSNFHSAIWDSATNTQQELEGGDFPRDVEDSGWAVGSFGSRWLNGMLQDYELGGAVISNLNAINSSGSMVGAVALAGVPNSQRETVWDSNGRIIFQTDLVGDLWGGFISINDSGFAVGKDTRGSRSSGVVWHADTGLVSANSLLRPEDSRFEILQMSDVTSNFHAAGRVRDENGVEWNAVLEPVPEPGTMLALGAGLAALLRRRRTR